MVTITLSLETLSDLLWSVLEDESDGNGNHRVEFSGGTEQEAWDKVARAFIVLAKIAQEFEEE